MTNLSDCRGLPSLPPPCAASSIYQAELFVVDYHFHHTSLSQDTEKMLKGILKALDQFEAEVQLQPRYEGDSVSDGGARSINGVPTMGRVGTSQVKTTHISLVRDARKVDDVTRCRSSRQCNHRICGGDLTPTTRITISREIVRTTAGKPIRSSHRAAHGDSYRAGPRIASAERTRRRPADGRRNVAASCTEDCSSHCVRWSGWYPGSGNLELAGSSNL